MKTKSIVVIVIAAIPFFITAAAVVIVQWVWQIYEVLGWTTPFNGS